MGNIKKVLLVVDDDRVEIYSTLAALCRGESLNYYTIRKKWKGDTILHKRLTIYKKEVLR